MQSAEPVFLDIITYTQFSPLNLCIVVVLTLELIIIRSWKFSIRNYLKIYLEFLFVSIFLKLMICTNSRNLCSYSIYRYIQIPFLDVYWPHISSKYGWLFYSSKSGWFCIWSKICAIIIQNWMIITHFCTLNNFIKIGRHC